jgi:large subunit ribosomal protein L24
MRRSKQPRKQRKARFNAPSHKRRKMISSHLSDELIKTYNVRSIPIRKGDLVRVIRGNSSIFNKECLVTDIFSRNLKIGLEGINVKKSDGTEVARMMDPSNLLIIKLDLTDPLRREKLEKLAGGLKE